MPVSLGEWRVRIGRFVHSVREYVIRERKVKLLKERIRRLKILQKRLLEKKEKSEDECESRPNDLSVKVDDALNESNNINSETTNVTHKEESSRSEFTTGDEHTFHFFFTLLLSLFSLLLSLIFFFVFDFSNLLASYKSFLEWSYYSEFSWRSICPILITVSSSLAYFVLSYVIKNNANLQDNLVLIRDENAKAESTTKVNNTPTESILKENTPTEYAIGKNYSITDTGIKEKNATESDKECNNIQTNATIKEINTPSISRDGPLESKQSKTKISKRKTIKEKNTTSEFNIREISTLPESTIKDNIAPKECHIDTSSTRTNKPSKRKTLKRKTTKDIKTETESTHKSNNTITETTIKANDSPTESNIIKDNNAQTRSTIKDNNTKTESTIKESSTPSTITDKSSKRKMSRIKTVKDKIIPTESHIKEHNTTIGSTINNKSAPTESAIEYNIKSTESTIPNINTTTKASIKYNNSVTESTIKESRTCSTIKDKLSKRKISKRKITKHKNTATKSKINGNTTTTESTIKEYNSSTESTIKGSNTSVKSAIKDNNSPTEYTIKKNNSTAKSVNKGSNSTTDECTIKNSNAPAKSTIKGNNTSSESTITEANTPTESPIRGNNSTSESTTIDSNTTTMSAIKEDFTPSRTPTEENNNQTMKVNTTQAEYTIRSGTRKVLSEGKHSVSSQIPSSLKGTTDDPVVQESTCLPEMILVKAGDVEQNPGPFDRTANIQEQELINLAYDVPSSKYTNLCIALGVSYNQSQTILGRHLLDPTKSLHAVFFEWKDRQRDGTDCRQVIATALRGVNLDSFGDKMSKGGYLRQEAAPTESTVEDETQPLTKEQVDQCAQDFKTFYRTRLCKIKTDPLDFNFILEFERIYTNLILLRKEMGTTRKTPLDYAELLTTKVNGVLPKRLMVEGEGGAGKTTFCSKIAWDWAEKTKEFEEFDWVLVIPFRSTKEGQTVGDIAKTYLSDSNTVQPRQIDKYILSAPTKVFIIFDGLDEYEGDILKESTDIAKILRSEKFVECRVMVTTRPWRAVPFKSHEIMMQTFAFLAIAGFDKENISIYITKYFQDDPAAGYELIKYIESNDQIQENMAPFPLYIAMLCILWRNSDADKRNIIRKLKTFSQLFSAIIISLTDHCLTKQHQNPKVKILTNKEMNNYLSQIGKISYSGVLEKRLMYTENDFSENDEAMEACCRIGVLSREIRIVPRQERRLSETNPVTSSVFFPHKLFQEYLAGMYLASLFESDDHEQYDMAMDGVIQKAEEFRYLLYFTASQTKKVATDVTSRLIKIEHYRHILVDVTFEAYDEDAAKVVGQHFFAEQKSLEIDDMMSAHTVSGYLFIMEKLTLETLIVSRTSCGPTVSRDLADVICSSAALTSLEFRGTKFHDDFYSILEGKVKTSKVERLSLKSMAISNEQASRSLARFLNNLPKLKDLTLRDNHFNGRFYTELASGARSVEVRASGHSVRKLHLDHRCHNDILQHGFTVEMLFPNLEHLYFTSSQAVSPDIVGSLAHSGLKELSFETVELYIGDSFEVVPLVGDPSSLEHVFLKSFPLLTNLSFKELVIGNNRCKIILSSLKQHQHLKNLCIIHCYTDEELDPIVSAINMENRMKVNIQHDQDQKRLGCIQMSPSLADALCNRTSIQELCLIEETIFSNAWFSEEKERIIDSKIEKVCIHGCHLHEKPTASRDLARFLCLLPCLTDLTIQNPDDPYNRLFLGDDFYHELARQAPSSKIEKVYIHGCNLNGNDPTASRDLARFLCLLPCLTELTIKDQYNHLFLRDDFYHELALQASSLKIEKVCIQGFNLRGNDPTASRDLARFLCLLPCLTDLTIKDSEYQYEDLFLRDDFYHELARQASFSKIEKVCIQACNLNKNDPIASRDLARFLCLLPCLTDLMIKDSDDQFNHLFLCDDFYHELARQASSLKIEKVCIQGCYLNENDPTASRDLARFLCFLPCLTDLTIKDSGDQYEDIFFRGDFYHELARQASSSKIEKVCIQACNLNENDPTVSRDLARIICLLPCLTDLTIKDTDDPFINLFLRDDFYHELARQAPSSKVICKIEKVCIQGCNLRENDPTASRDLARFLCLLPCLTDLMIKDSDDQFNHLFLRDDFYHELARQASSSKIEKLYIDCYLKKNDRTASRDLASFLCLLPCLTDMTVEDAGKQQLYDDFYLELALLASSSKNPFFTNLMTRTTWFNEHRSRSVLQGPLAPLQMTNRQGRLPSQFEQPHQQYHTYFRTDLLRPQALHSTEQYQDIYRLSDPGDLLPTGPQDYPPLWQSSHHPQQYQSLGDVPTACSSQMINPHQGMTPTTRLHRQASTSGTFLPPAITYHHNQQHQTHVPHHLPFSQTPVSQEACQYPVQNRVGEPFLPFQQSRQQDQPIMSQSQELIQNSHQQLYFPWAPPQRETQNRLTHLSGSQQSEQSNQLAQRFGEPQVHP